MGKKEKLCGCWIKCKECNLVLAFEYSLYKKNEGNFAFLSHFSGLRPCKRVEGCPSCEIFKFENGKFWKLEKGKVAREEGRILKEGGKDWWERYIGNSEGRENFSRSEVRQKEGDIFGDLCEEHQKKIYYPLIKPTIKEVEEFYSDSAKANKRYNLLKKAYYLNDDCLIMEYNKSYKGEELLPDRFTTNSEGLFLGYEEIPEDSPISEAIEVFKNNIQQLLNKLNVKVEQLSEEFQNWKEKISTLKSSKEVSQFFDKMARAAEKVHVNQNNNQPVSNKDKFPYWVFISISLLLVTVLVGIIIYRRKKRK